MIQPGHHREDGEDDRYRAAQTDPADKDPLTQIKAAERQQAGKHRQWTGEEDHPRGEKQRRNGNRQQIGRRHQQTQHQEHADLRQPGQPVEVLQDRVAIADRAVAEQKTT